MAVVVEVEIVVGCGEHFVKRTQRMGANYVVVCVSSAVVCSSAVQNCDRLGGMREQVGCVVSVGLSPQSQWPLVGLLECAQHLESRHSP